MNPRTLARSLTALINPRPQDRAAREWRLTAPRRAPSAAPAPDVIFCAPLMGRHMAQDWAVISASVAQMVATLLAQRDPHWRLVLCGQDTPDGVPQDPRITFLPFTKPVEGMDKGPKIRALMAHLPHMLDGRDGYMHALDADDFLHPDLVAHIRRDNNGRGYWHRLGGMIDAGSGRIAHCGPRSLRYPTARPFLSQCGSSAAIYVDFRTLDTRAAEMALAFYRAGHRNFHRVAQAHGIKLEPIPFPAALYVMNTGENMRQKRGLLHRKMRYLDQNTLPEPEQAALRHAFSLPAP